MICGPGCPRLGRHPTRTSGLRREAGRLQNWELAVPTICAATATGAPRRRLAPPADAGGPSGCKRRGGPTAATACPPACRPPTRRTRCGTVPPRTSAACVFPARGRPHTCGAQRCSNRPETAPPSKRQRVFLQHERSRQMKRLYESSFRWSGTMGRRPAARALHALRRGGGVAGGTCAPAAAARARACTAALCR